MTTTINDRYGFGIDNGPRAGGGRDPGPGGPGRRGLRDPHRDRCVGHAGCDARGRLASLPHPRGLQSSATHQALSQEEDIGLLLPCNIIIACRDHTTAVRVMEPFLMAQLTEAPGLVEIAAEARRRLSRALTSLPTLGAG